jgi:hypothetical protein
MCGQSAQQLQQQQQCRRQHKQRGASRCCARAACVHRGCIEEHYSGWQGMLEGSALQAAKRKTAAQQLLG